MVRSHCSTLICQSECGVYTFPSARADLNKYPSTVIGRLNYLQCFVVATRTTTLASYQIRKIAGCACTGKAGNVFSATDFKGNRPRCAGKTFPTFPAHAQPVIFRIWQTAHWSTSCHHSPRPQPPQTPTLSHDQNVHPCWYPGLKFTTFLRILEKDTPFSDETADFDV